MAGIVTMASLNNEPNSVSDEISDLLLRWQDLRRQGKNPSAEELCSGRAELLGELERQIHALEEMEAMLGVGKETGTDTPAGQSDRPSFPDLDGDPFRIPGHEILDTIDRGGMGIVYKARHIRLNRIVAIKMILAGSHAPKEQLARFRTETEAVAQLHHPNIVEIFDVGEADGQPYYSMEFVEGGSLERVLAKALLPPSQAARLIQSLAEAIHAAHQRGIIHRDLKPGNILLSGEWRVTSDEEKNKKGGEWRVASDEEATGHSPRTTPKITDFGLAKRLDGTGGNTLTGAVLGTPSYMAPEQAEGKNRQIGPAVDIYALGAILYEMLTGRPPFKGETTLDTLEQVRLRDPVAPSRLHPELPRDLETICLKCLEKSPQRRYGNAGILAEEVRRFLDGEPIMARPSSIWEKGFKWAKRKPALASLMGVSAVAVLGLLTSWIFFTAELTAQVALARQEEKRALDQEGLARENQKTAEQQKERAELLLSHCVQAIVDQSKAVVNSKLDMRQTGEPGTILFGMAQYFAKKSDFYRKDHQLAEEDREKLAALYANRSIDFLENTWKLHFFGSARNLQQLQRDRDLSLIRTLPNFQNLISRIEAKPGGE
jgi:serine/threonine protein kinase